MELKVCISCLLFNRFDSVTDFTVARCFHGLELFAAIYEGVLNLVGSLVRNPVDELALRFACIALDEVSPRHMVSWVICQLLKQVLIHDFLSLIGISDSILISESKGGLSCHFLVFKSRLAIVDGGKFDIVAVLLVIKLPILKVEVLECLGS